MHRENQHSHWVRGIAFGLSLSVGLSLGASTAAAQTLFQWPTDTADVTRYTSVEE